MSAIKLSTPSSGSISLSPANTASNLTITVPAVTGTMLTNKTAGTVLQVVQGTYSTDVSNTTSTYADTGLTASITPTSSSSKILVIINQAGVGKSNDNSGSGVTLNIVRNSTQLIEFAVGLGRNVSASYNLAFVASTSYLDSPSTTSATTYKTQFKNYANASSVYVQSYNPTSTITLMEIAG